MKHAEDAPVPGPKASPSSHGPPIDRTLQPPHVVQKKRKMQCLHHQQQQQQQQQLQDAVVLKVDPQAAPSSKYETSPNNLIAIGYPELKNDKQLLRNDLNAAQPGAAAMWVWRHPRKRLVVLAVAGLCFLLGVAVPLLLRCNQSHAAKGISLTESGAPLRHSSGGRSASPFHFDLAPVLKDLFISVKTTKKYHHPRLVILLETWVSLVRAQTWFFTDVADSLMSQRTDGHLIVTKCAESHSRTALACKMATEYDAFVKSHKSWWCHFDDDNYVHVSRLGRLLQSFSPSQPVYLGKPSTAKPLEIFDSRAPHNTSHFWFATGGAGFCISRALALKMAPYAANGKFVETGDQFWFPDDVTLGYIIEHLLGEQLTVVPEFHSHLEPMGRLLAEDLDEQITFSYINYDGIANVLNLDGPFTTEVDPTRFYSLHCRLYSAPYCPEELS